MMALLSCGDDPERQAIVVPTPEPKNWVLVWADEFDQDGAPDNTKWDYDLGGGGWGNNELEVYTNNAGNVRVENGRLVIEARKESDGTYTSTRIVSRKKGDWTYAKVEVRAKLPKGRGTWPAIWMLPTDWTYGSWPSSGEIDIMEAVGFDPGVIHASMHTESYNWTKGTQKTSTISVPSASDEFHVYTLEWTTSGLTFKVDDSAYYTIASETSSYKTWPFDQRFHLLMNIAIGGNWGGQKGVDDSIWPQRMEIDYVKVYQ